MGKGFTQGLPKMEPHYLKPYHFYFTQQFPRSVLKKRKKVHSKVLYNNNKYNNPHTIPVSTLPNSRITAAGKFFLLFQSYIVYYSNPHRTKRNYFFASDLHPVAYLNVKGRYFDVIKTKEGVRYKIGNLFSRDLLKK